MFGLHSVASPRPPTQHRHSKDMDGFIVISTIFTVVAALTNIPAFVYYIKLFRKESEEKKPSKERTPSDVVQSLVSPAEERVLIEFNPDQANVPGTFEAAVMTLVRASPEDDVSSLIYNPRGFRNADSVIVRVREYESVMAAIAMLIVWVVLLATSISVLFYYHTPDSELSPWRFLALMPLFILAGLPFGAWSYKAKKQADRFRARRDAADAYLDYLKSREIDIGLEFTQSKRMYEQEKASAIGDAKPIR